MPTVSHQIGFKAAQALYYAEMQASRIGKPLTHSVTINWSVLGVDPREAVALFAKIRSQRYANWIRRPPKKDEGRIPSIPTYAYAFENESWEVDHAVDDPTHNVHVHWSVHVPQGVSTLGFEGVVTTWIDEVVRPTSFPATALVVQEITHHGSVGYMIKGAAKGTAAHFGKKRKPQGEIYGKRSGTTRNIGPKARREVDKLLGKKRERFARRDQISPLHQDWLRQPQGGLG